VKEPTRAVFFCTMCASRLTPDASAAHGVRLQKVIADAGVASRRKAEELITAGRVVVNGRVVRELGTRVDPERDHVKVDGRHLKAAPPQAFIMLNKPKGVLSTLNDPEGRPTIRDLLHGVSLRVFPVGRLDFDTEGLMLLTNDGEIAQMLLHPRYHVSKTYLAKVKGVLADEEIRELERGVSLEDGRTAPAIVKKAGKAEANSWIELTIYEGRKHQVKRMLERVGHPVLKLERIRFGPLTLGDLPVGRYRFLTDREANAIRAAVAARVRGEASGIRTGQSKDLPAHHLVGVRKRDAHYSSRRAPVRGKR
jgi:23S rRNA pseudouridine2605 synthase